MTNEEFIRMVVKLSGAYSPLQVFQDACRMIALAIHSALLCFDPAAKERAEREYAELVEKYGKENEAAFAQLFRAVAEKLEVTRTDFLGGVMERMGATNKGTSQFLTPRHLAHFMGMVAFEGKKPVPGEIVYLSDPCCGAGVLLIVGANAFIDAGGRQGDILIRAEDLDYNAFNSAFVQLSLLGFAAVVTRMDSLSREVFEGPWYTPGYFLHAMPMRLAGKNTTTTNKE